MYRFETEDEILRRALLEEPKTVKALEEVRAMYMTMLDIRDREGIERLRDYFKYKLKEKEVELRLLREHPESPPEIVATKEKLIMLYKGLIREAEARLG